MKYDEHHDYGLVKLNDRQYQKCDKHCCNVKLGKRACYCYPCRAASPERGE